MVESLSKLNKTVCLRVHPEEDNWFGLKARVFLYSKGKSAHFASALFYMVDVIRSILLYSWRKVDYVIFVRYLMGTAYLPSPLHIIGYNFFASWVPKSRNMYFLDVTPHEAAARISANRKEKEMFESLEALKKVRAKALSLTRYSNWIILDSDRPEIEVAQTLRASLKN